MSSVVIHGCEQVEKIECDKLDDMDMFHIFIRTENDTFSMFFNTETIAKLATTINQALEGANEEVN